jgi:aminopeptidase N
MEYPGLIMAYGPLGSDGGGAGSYSEYVVAHEVGHQWFYSLVGNDEVHDPWLDEALATYTDMLFLRDQAPWAFRSYWQRNLAAYRNRAAYGGDRLVNTTVYDYPSDGPYFDIVYR